MPRHTILVCGPAVSPTNDRVDDWKKKVETEVRKHWSERPLPADRTVAVTITYFGKRRQGPHDVDNLAKPILDATKEIVYDDDEQVSDLLCRRRYPGIDPPPLKPPVGLDEYLGQSKPVVIIELDPDPSPTVEF